MTTRIYHITSAIEASRTAKSGEYAPEDFAAIGFIHCSYLHQLCAVANTRFTGRRDLVVLEIDRTKLRCEVIDENLDGGAEGFPHIYGRLPMSAVADIHEFPCAETGRFNLPLALEDK